MGNSKSSGMLAQRLMWIAWPAFIMAGVTEMVVFAMVDPQDIHWFGHPLTLTNMGIYSLAFFVFWALCICSSALTTLLSASPFEENRCPVEPQQRPHDCAKLEGRCH